MIQIMTDLTQSVRDLIQILNWINSSDKLILDDQTRDQLICKELDQDKILNWWGAKTETRRR